MSLWYEIIKGCVLLQNEQNSLILHYYSKRKKKGRGDGIIQSIPIAFEYLNNVFYTHFFLGTIGWLWEVISAIRMYTNNIPVLLSDYVFAEHIHLIRYDF